MKKSVPNIFITSKIFRFFLVRDEPIFLTMLKVNFKQWDYESDSSRLLRHHLLDHWVDIQIGGAKIKYNFGNRMIFLSGIGKRLLEPFQVNSNRCICNGISSGLLSQYENDGDQRTWFMQKIFDISKSAIEKECLIKNWKFNSARSLGHFYAVKNCRN